jgi:hypothetical protein
MYFGRLMPAWSYTLIVLSLLTLVLFVYQAVRLGSSNNRKFKISFYLSTAAVLAPLISLTVGLWVFTFSHSHPTAQFAAIAQSSGVGENYWSDWFTTWSFSIISHLLGLILVVTSLFICFQCSNKLYLLYRLMVLSLLVVSFYSLAVNMPDA